MMKRFFLTLRLLVASVAVRIALWWRKARAKVQDWIRIWTEEP